MKDVLIICCIGLIFGFIFHSLLKQYWKASFVAGVVSMIIWFVGDSAYLKLKVPNRGWIRTNDLPDVFGSLLFVMFITLFSAMIIGFIMRIFRKRKNKVEV